MLNVRYRVMLGSTALESAPSGPVVGLLAESALAVPANACRVELHGGAKVAAAPGDPVVVELGYSNALETVFTGVVTASESGFAGVRAEAMGAFAALAAARLNLLYEKETAGAIVRDVLGKTGVPEGTVESGLKLPTFALDEGANAWTHLHGLARRCGFDFFADERDRAHFRARAAGRTHRFAYGAEILDYTFSDRPAEVAGVEVRGFSPAGQGQGDDASSWFTRREVRGTAGKTTGRVLRVVDAAARDRGLAGSVASGLLATGRRSAAGSVRLLGAPAVRLGDAVTLEGLPARGHDGTGRVVAVRHRLHPRQGFVTTVHWERE